MSENDASQPLRLSPLLPSDPPQVDEFWLDARLTATPSGVAFVAHDAASTSVIVILLSEGAAHDAGARDRFAGTVNQLHLDTVIARGGHGQDGGRLQVRYRSNDDDPDLGLDSPSTPWVALAYDASPAALAEARRILAEVDLSVFGFQGRPSGPDYRLPWARWSRPGIAKVWPLPWPGRRDRSGWLSMLVAWLLMLLLCALAILIAILLFRDSPPQAPPPPVPTTVQGSPEKPPTPSPASASPNKGKSPTPDSKL